MAQTRLPNPPPREVIEHIRRYEFGIGAALEGDGRVVVDNMVRKYRSLLATVAEDLNSKASHFILELIQNADDNHYAAGVAPSLSFRLEPTRLAITNNEVGFTADNVKALCSAGESSKKNKSGYIGEKGIGFKSVFKVTDAPEIHSNGYHFQFNRTDPTDLLGYVVPYWLEPGVSFATDATTVVLPSKPGLEFRTELLADLDATLLLFLGKLKRLEVITEVTSIQHLREDDRPKTHLTTIQTSAGTANSIIRHTYLRTEFAVDMSAIKEPKRDGILARDLVMAFPLSEEGAAAPISACPTYAFLPIRAFGFNFCIQADFVLISSREGIHEDLPWNLHLRDAIAPAFVAAIEQFKNQPTLAKSFLRFLPSEGDIADPFFKPVVNQIVEALEDCECIPVEGGGWRKPSQVLLAPAAIRELFPSEDAVVLFGADYPAPGLLPRESELKQLSFRSLLISDVLEVFGKHLTWFTKKDSDWKARFFKYIAQSPNRSAYLDAMQELPCIPTTGGKLVTPKEQAVFYPLSSEQKYGFEHELTILDGEFYESAVQLAPEVQKLFDGLNVRRDNPYELIQSHILLRHTPEGIATADQPALLGHVRYIRDKLDQFLKKATETQTEEVALQVLRDGLFLGGKRSEAGSWYFSRPDELYLSNDYRPDFNIEVLLGDKMPLGKLLSEKYIIKQRGSIGKDLLADDLARWREFFVRIGVHDAPKVVHLASGDVACSEELTALLEAEDQSVRRATLECLNRHWSSFDDSTTYQVKVSRYNTSAHRTQFIDRLRASAAPTKRRTSVSLAQSYHDRPEIRGILGGNLVFVDATINDERFFKACGITYAVDATACLKRLRQIRTDGGSTKDQIRRIYRHLETLWSAEHQAIESAFMNEPLIAVGRGESIAWVKPPDACWRATGVRFLDARHPPLSAQYVDHSNFFTKLLHVPIELVRDKWVDGLTELPSVESASERGEIALTIYRRLSRDLGSLAASKPPVPLPTWLTRFKTHPLFLSHRSVLVPNTPSLFFNDVPEYAPLFEDIPGLSLLAVPHEQLSAISHLIERTGVRKLSTNLNVEVAAGVEGELNEQLTNKVREMLLLIARVAYGHSHESFENAIKENLFETLCNIEVLTVPNLALDITLNGAVRRTAGPVSRRGHQLLLSADVSSHPDYVAMEVRKLLRLPLMLTDIISRILNSPTVRDVEEYLRLRNFSILPPEESAAFARVLSHGITTTDTDDLDSGVESDAMQVTGALSGQRAPVGNVPSGAGAIPTRFGDDTPLLKLAGVGKLSPTTSDSSTSTAPIADGASSANATPRAPTERGPATSDGGGSATSATYSQADGPASASPSKSSTLTAPPRDDDGGPFATESATSGTFAPYGAQDRTGSHSARSGRRSGKSVPTRTKRGRLLSYAEPSDPSSLSSTSEMDEDSELSKHKRAVEEAAVNYFMETAAANWKSLKVMLPGNPGFDISAITLDGKEEFIEVKGQGGAWTEEGVALTRTELAKAHSERERYWLCVVEYAIEQNRRQLYLIRDPFGLTTQFRFDKGWKAMAKTIATRPTKPESGMFVTVPEEGTGRIVKVKGSGTLVKLHIEFEDGKQLFSKIFNPATMTIGYE